ncbi:MAG: GNAT family N-acetyltransferase [Gelidibacter sp.]|nr:GNAT family N-acetyltransferase [Gelidibacter sp.]
MHTLIRTNSQHPDFINLVAKLDKDLAIRDGDEHSFYDQFNKITHIKHVVVAYNNGIAISCGAIKEFDANTMEVKRMYTIPEHRGKGLASKILNELEVWAKELNYKKCVLETGKKQPEAIALYTKNGYKTTPNYGQYIGIENSVCFEKTLK